MSENNGSSPSIAELVALAKTGSDMHDKIIKQRVKKPGNRIVESPGPTLNMVVTGDNVAKLVEEPTVPDSVPVAVEKKSVVKEKAEEPLFINRRFPDDLKKIAQYVKEEVERKAVSDLQQKLRDAKNALSTANQSLESLRAGSAANASKMRELEVSIKRNEAEISRLLDEKATIVNEVVSEKSNNQTNQTRIAELNEKLAKFQSELVNNRATLLSLEIEKGQLVEIINKLYAEIEGLNGKVTELEQSSKAEKESAQDKLNNTARANSVLTEKIRQKLKEVAAAELTVDKWKKRVEDKNSEIAAFKDEIARIKSEREKENARLLEINNKIIASKNSLKNLLNKDLIEQDDKIDSLNDEINNLVAEKDDIEILVTHSQHDFTLQSEELKKKIVELGSEKLTTTRLVLELLNMREEAAENESLRNTLLAEISKLEAQIKKEGETSQSTIIGLSKALSLTAFERDQSEAEAENREMDEKEKEKLDQRLAELGDEYKEEHSTIEEMLERQKTIYNGKDYLEDQDYLTTKSTAEKLKFEEQEKKRKIQEERAKEEKLRREAELAKELAANEEMRKRTKRIQKAKMEESKVENEQKRVADFKEGVNKVKNTNEIFELGKKFLSLSETDSKMFNDQLCDYLYKNGEEINDKLAGTGFKEKLDRLRDDYQKNLQTLGELQSWEDVEVYLAQISFNNNLHYPIDQEVELKNAADKKHDLVEKYIGKELMDKIFALKDIFERKNIFDLRKVQIEKELKSGNFGFLERALQSERHFKIDQEFVTKIVGEVEGENGLVQKINEYSQLGTVLNRPFSITFAGKEFDSKQKLLTEMVKKEVEGARVDFNELFKSEDVKERLVELAKIRSSFNNTILGMISKYKESKTVKFVEYDDIYYVLTDARQLNVYLNYFYDEISRKVGVFHNTKRK